MEEAGTGEDRTEGGNDFCYAYCRYYLETQYDLHIISRNAYHGMERLKGDFL